MNCFCILLAILAIGNSPAAPPHAANQPASQLEIAKRLLAEKQVDKAEAVIVAAMMTAPTDPQWLTELAEVRLDQGRAQESFELVEEASKLGGATPLRAELAGLAASEAGRLDLAEPQFRAAIRLDPNYAAAHYFLARLLYTQNHFDESIEESRKTIALSPSMVRAYENIGLCYEGKQQYSEAERWHLQAIRLDDASAGKTEWPMLDLATMMIYNNRISEARPYLEQAIAINPKNAQSRFEMGVFREKSGDPEGALDQFRQAIQLDPHLSGAYYHAAKVCQRLHRGEDARHYFAQFQQLLDAKH